MSSGSRELHGSDPTPSNTGGPDFLGERLRLIREGLKEGVRREVERLESLGLPLCVEDTIDDLRTPSDPLSGHVRE